MNATRQRLLERVEAGDRQALNELVDASYAELRRIAARRLRRERGDHTLQTTALVHEAYVRIFEGAARDFNGRVHFLAVASRVMRQILVDHARARLAKKRGGDAVAEWTVGAAAAESGALERIEIVALDAALDALAREDQALARLIEMRYFGGMTAEESAAALGLSIHVVRHDLRLAHAWLRRYLDR